MSSLIDELRAAGHKIPRRRKERGLSPQTISEIAESMVPVMREYANDQVEMAVAPLLDRIDKLEEQLRKFKGVEL